MQSDSPSILLSLKHHILTMFHQGVISFNTDLTKFNFDISMHDYFLSILPILQKAPDTRGEDEIKLVYGYFSYLKDFIATIHDLDPDSDNYLETLRTVAGFLSCEYRPTNRIIIQQGDKGKKFYMILQGNVDVLVPNPIKGCLYERNYYRYLGLLIEYNELELLDIVLRDNYGVFPIEIVNCGNNGRVKLKKATNLDKANLTKEFVVGYLNEEDRRNIKRYYSGRGKMLHKEDYAHIKVSVEEYIKRLAIELDKGNTYREKNETEEKDKDKEKDKKVKQSIKQALSLRDNGNSNNDNTVNISPNFPKKTLVFRDDIQKKSIFHLRKTKKSFTTKSLSKDKIDIINNSNDNNNSIFNFDNNDPKKTDSEEEQDIELTPLALPPQDNDSYVYNGQLYHNLLIYNYIKITQLETGKGFGDIALVNPGIRRTATIISNTQCYFGVLNKINYTKSLKKANERITKKLHGFIRSTTIFYELPNRLTQLYDKYFVLNKMTKGESVIHQYSHNDKIYLLREGIYEATIDSSFSRICAMINHFNTNLILPPSQVKTSEDAEIHRTIHASVAKMNMMTRRIEGLIKEVASVKDFYLQKHHYCLWNIKSPEYLGFQQLEYGDDGNAFTVNCISLKGVFLHIEKDSYDNLCRVFPEVVVNEKEYCYKKVLKLLQRLIVIQESRLQAYVSNNDKSITQMITSDNHSFVIPTILLKRNSCKGMMIKANSTILKQRLTLEEKRQNYLSRSKKSQTLRKTEKDSTTANGISETKSTFITHRTNSARYYRQGRDVTERSVNQLSYFRTLRKNASHDKTTLISLPKYLRNNKRVDVISKVLRQSDSFDNGLKPMSSIGKTQKIAAIYNTAMKKRHCSNLSTDQKYNPQRIKQQFEDIIQKNIKLIKATHELLSRRNGNISARKPIRIINGFNNNKTVNTLYINN